MRAIKRFLIWFLFPAVRLYWRIAKPKTFGVKVVVEKGTKILLVRHSYWPEFWSFPGGGIQRGEQPEDATRRELREELRMGASNIRTVGFIETVFEGKNDTVTILVAGSDDNPMVDEVEILEARWFDISSMPPLGAVASKVFNHYRFHGHQD